MSAKILYFPQQTARSELFLIVLNLSVYLIVISASTRPIITRVFMGSFSNDVCVKLKPIRLLASIDHPSAISQNQDNHYVKHQSAEAGWFHPASLSFFN
ncbi:MAG: hypothetical protein ACFHWX_20300 [Bacteroidota bacterium]